MHGKNPARDGTFRAVVERIELCDRERRLVVADAAQNDATLFAATFAGFGLTGIITRATLRLARPPAALVLRRMPVANLADAARVCAKRRTHRCCTDGTTGGQAISAAA